MCKVDGFTFFKSTITINSKLLRVKLKYRSLG
jgi:hypothetical protein